MDAFAKALIRNYVKAITIESNVTPRITIRDPFADKGPSPISDAAISAIRPKITIEAWDQKPLVIAPAGDPIKLGGVGIGTILLGAILGSGLVYGIVKVSRR